VTSFVLDNSVTMRWCFDAGTHPYADGVLHQLEAINGLALVPVLWRYEVSAVLARARIKDEISAQEATDFLADLAELNIIVDVGGAERVLSSVYELAIAHRLTAYDAAYLELAQRRGLPLATLDQDLARACNAAGVPVL
jgi:predicted nucleic acid-binding protein